MKHHANPPGPLEYALLGLLRLAPRHGYDLAAEFRPGADLGSALRVELADLYAALKRLERHELVTSHVEAAGARPPRHVYALTPEGIRLFERWLVEPVGRNRDIRLDFILKLYFIPRLAPEQRETLLARQLTACLDQLARLQAEAQRFPAGSFGWSLRTMRISAVRATISWLKEMLATPSPL